MTETIEKEHVYLFNKYILSTESGLVRSIA